jgi:hypothetical protein
MPPGVEAVVIKQVAKVLPHLDQPLILAVAVLLADPPVVGAAAQKRNPPKVQARRQQLAGLQGMVGHVHGLILCSTKKPL